MTNAEVCAEAARHGVRAEVVSDGRIQLPFGFLAWVDPQPFPARLVDDGVAQGTPGIGPACLQISGGTNETERWGHQATEEVRKATAAMARQLQLLAAPDEERIISKAALKVERLTGLLRSLAPLAESVILPQAGNMAYPSAQFQEVSAEYDVGAYHSPLYVFSKLRTEEDGPYASSLGMFLFGLPDMAIPLPGGVPPVTMVRAMSNLQREMVAEGWWPENGKTFQTESVGRVRIEHVQDALFLVPEEMTLDPARVAVARHRFALERCALQLFGRSTMFRVRPPGMVVDHHLLPGGKSFAITCGVSMVPQKGGTADDENDRVEIVLFSDKLGPWATKWLQWIHGILRHHDGSHPIRPFDRLVLPGPMGGIAAGIVWPWGHLSPFGSGGERVHLWCLLPILEEELAAFRADPSAQGAWIDERGAKGDVETLFRRWDSVA